MNPIAEDYGDALLWPQFLDQLARTRTKYEHLLKFRKVLEKMKDQKAWVKLTRAERRADEKQKKLVESLYPGDAVDYKTVSFVDIGFNEGVYASCNYFATLLYSNEEIAEARYPFSDDSDNSEEEEEEQDLYDRFPGGLQHAEFWKHLNGYVYKWDLLHWYLTDALRSKSVDEAEQTPEIERMADEEKVHLLLRAYPREAEALRNMNYRAIGFCLGARDGIKYLLALKRGGRDEADEQFPRLQLHKDQ